MTTSRCSHLPEVLPDCTSSAAPVVKTVEDYPITLADVARVQVGAKAPKLGLASERGKPAVLVTVTKQPNTNTLELTERVDESIRDLQRTLPGDVRVSTDIFRQSRFIESSIGNIRSALLEGAVFVVVVLFFFLMNSENSSGRMHKHS